MELRDYYRVLRKYWALIVAITLVGIGVAAGVTMLITPTYQARTELYVSVQGEGGSTGEMVQGSTYARQSMASYVRIATTESVLAPAAEALEMPLGALVGKVSASAPNGTSMITIAVTGEDPVRAAQIANAVGASFQYVVEDTLEVTSPGEQSPVKATTVQSASIPTTPISPSLRSNILVGAIVGLALGLAMAAIRTLTDTRVRTVQDVEAITDAPVLGGIIFDPEAKKRPLVVHADPRNPLAEAFRSLRTNLQFLAINEDSTVRGRSFVISSAGPGEGKSTTIANLAVALAETGSRVALVDADLRLPKVATTMGIEGAVGLTDVLIGTAKLSDAMQRWGRGNLYVLPAGQVPPNPSELLGSKAMQSLLKNLNDHFDYVLIDAPPLLLVTDAAVVSKHTNGVILAVAAGATQRPALEMAIRTLEAGGAHLRGIVLTMVPASGPDSYSYGAYGYGYGYGSTAPTAEVVVDAIEPTTGALAIDPELKTKDKGAKHAENANIATRVPFSRVAAKAVKTSEKVGR